jgi:hypothetical protein
VHTRTHVPLTLALACSFAQSNFATLDPKTNIVISRRADRNFEDLGPPLCSYLNHLYNSAQSLLSSSSSSASADARVAYREIPGFPEYQVDFKYATEHRYLVSPTSIPRE